MKITKARLKEIIKEDISKAAYRAGYEDAFQGRPYNKDSRMRELNPRMYDYGFSRGTDAAMEDNRRPDEIDQRLNERTSAVEEKLTRTRLKKIIKEELSITNVTTEVKAPDADTAAIRETVRNIIMEIEALAELIGPFGARIGIVRAIVALKSKKEQYVLKEELTRQDKTDVKKMVKDELEKLLKKKEMKDQISELTKKILKKLYKDLSLEHPYIIDRIKI